MTRATRRPRERWAVELDVLMDRDLRLGAGTGAVVVVGGADADDRRALLDAFERTAVHSVGRSAARAEGTSPWHAALEALAAVIPSRQDLRSLADLVGEAEFGSTAGQDTGPTAADETLDGQVAPVLDALVDAARVHPFVLVLDEVDDAVSWRLADAVASLVHRLAVLVVMSHDRSAATMRLSANVVHLVLDVDTLPPTGDDAPETTEVSGAIRADSVSDGADKVMLAIALLGRPASITLLARIVGRSWLEVSEDVDELERAGHVTRANGQTATVQLTSGITGRGVTAGASIARRQVVHRAIAEVLADDSNGAPLLADAVTAAMHALSGNGDHRLVVRTCLQAGVRCEEAGDLATALELFQNALDTSPPVLDRIRLLTGVGRVAGRLGDGPGATAAFTAAAELAVTLDDPVVAIEVRADQSLTGSQIRRDDDEPRRLLASIDQLGDTRPDLRAIVLIRLADLVRLTDPTLSHRVVAEAIELAATCGVPDIEALALRMGATLASDHPMAHDLGQVVHRLSELPGNIARLSSFIVRAGQCSARGDRRTLDALVLAYETALRDHPMVLWEGDIATLRAAQAVHDADREGFAAAIRTMIDGSLRAGSISGLWTSAFVLIWYYNTGEDLMELLDPRLTVPSVGGTHHLFHFSGSLVAAELGDERARESLVLDLPRVEDVRGSWTTATWLPLLARAAVFAEDRKLAATMVDILAPTVDQWVRVGLLVPIGPTGWFVAEAQQWLGRTIAAKASAEAAFEAATKMRSVPWIARCTLQRARFAHAAGDNDIATELLASARRLARHHALGPIGREADVVGQMLESDLRGPEQEVLRLVTAGLSNKQIATTLGVSVKRVERLLSSAYKRLGVQNRAEAVATMLRRPH